jgi:hypothetical protein
MKSVRHIAGMLLFAFLAVEGVFGQENLPDGAHFAAKVRLRGLDNWQESIAYSPDGTLFASEGADHNTTIVEVKTGVIETVLHHSGQGLAFSPDSSILAVRSQTQTVELFDSHTGILQRSLPIPGPFAFSPDGQSIAGVTPANTITLYFAATGTPRYSFRDNSGTVYALAFSPDGLTLATANIDTMVRLFDVATGRQKKILQGHTDHVTQVAYSPDGLLLASAGRDDTVRIWNAVTGESKAILRGSARGTKSIAFSPDGSVLATGGWDYVVRLWNVSSGLKISTLNPPRATVMSLAFAPDGGSLAIGQWGVTLWATPDAKGLPPDSGLPLDNSLPGGRALDNDAPVDPRVQAVPIKPGREYFLVGPRHVFLIGPDPTLHQAERKEIEQTYMDGVAGDRAAYQARIEFGGNAPLQAKNRDADIEVLANERDQSLGTLYQLRDDLRESHPELKSIDVDGPYQVIGIDYEITGDNSVAFDDMVVYEPWPDYAFTGEPYGGWTYGTVYPARVFFTTYTTWRSGFRARWYYRGWYGHHGRIVVVNERVAGRVEDFGGRSHYSRVFVSSQAQVGGPSRPANRAQASNPRGAGVQRSAAAGRSQSSGRSVSRGSYAPAGRTAPAGRSAPPPASRRRRG